MTQRITTVYVDDLDGTESASEVRTVQFMLDGQPYEMELNAANLRRLRETLAPYVQAVRSRPRRSAPPKVYYSGEPNYAPAKATLAVALAPADLGFTWAQVRQWAEAAGYEISNGGKMPKAVTAEFMLAHTPKRRRRGVGKWV